jgi:ferredoxin-NADP reductase
VNATEIKHLELVVTEKTPVAGEVVQLVLQRADGAVLPPWEPGSHVSVRLPSGRERQYSLHGDVRDKSRYVISVLRQIDGAGGSREIHDQVHVGETLLVSSPVNHFALVPADSYVFIAGGIGVTPLIPMLQVVAEAGRPWRFMYGARDRGAMAYRDILAKATGGELTLAPQDEVGLLDVRGIVAGLHDDEVVYCCGPAALLDAVTAACAPERRSGLYIERFTPAERPAEVKDTGFDLELRQSNLTLTIPAGRSIQEVLLEETSLDVFSCGEGTCGTCEVRVLQGIPDHRDSILTDDEREANTVMFLCVSRSKTKRLVIDL